jgi:hypothetical protein
MRIVTAVEDLESLPRPIVFLAGGITNCPEWQKQVIVGLKNVQVGTLLNPRRENFPIHDPNASKEQITWEYRGLHMADVFSMWFCKGKSDQPICFYELGRYLALRQVDKQLDRVVIGVEEGFHRSQDVYIQTGLVNKKLGSEIYGNIEDYIVGLKDRIDKVALELAMS